MFQIPHNFTYTIHVFKYIQKKSNLKMHYYRINIELNIYVFYVQEDEKVTPPSNYTYINSLSHPNLPPKNICAISYTNTHATRESTMIFKDKLVRQASLRKIQIPTYIPQLYLYMCRCVYRYRFSSMSHKIVRVCHVRAGEEPYHV